MLGRGFAQPLPGDRDLFPQALQVAVDVVGGNLALVGQGVEGVGFLDEVFEVFEEFVFRRKAQRLACGIGVRFLRDGAGRVRTDISCTLFLSEPDEYDGGELVIEDTFGQQAVKLAAGDAIVYPGTSLHRVNPVTRGTRYASFFWTHSLVKSAEQRRLLFDLDQSIQQLTQEQPEHPRIAALSGTYHNLLRMWSES